MPGESPDVRQHDTHRELVGPIAPQSGPVIEEDLDAIIVPASRPAIYLDHAVTLARAAESQLVVLCSRDAKAAEVEQFLASRSFDGAIVIDLPVGYSHRLLDFATSTLGKFDLPAACASYSTDLSMKRNIGLILARMLAWERIFYLDDDIRDISSSHLNSTISMLGPYHTAGMRVSKFPDNSVVCHAHRETGGPQDVFVSGSALAVASTAAMSFFPDIYNEDWLFFYGDAAAGRLGSSGLHATQLCYDPFADPQRAAWQEFGDLLAEGLYGLLHRGARASGEDRDYWAYFLKARQSFLQAIIDRSDLAKAEIRGNMTTAVQKALECSIQIQPEDCKRYVGRWMKDLCRWQQQLTDLPRLPNVQRALQELELRPADGAAAGRIERALAGGPEITVASTLAGPARIPRVPTLDDRSDDTLPLLGFFSPVTGIQDLPSSGGPLGDPWRGWQQKAMSTLRWRPLRSPRPTAAAGVVRDAESAESGPGPAAAPTTSPLTADPVPACPA